jgi:hypothetical protein
MTEQRNYPLAVIERVPCWMVMSAGEPLAIVAAKDASAAAAIARKYDLEAESIVRLHDETRLLPGVEIVWAPGRTPLSVS